MIPKLKHRLRNSVQVLTYGAWQVWATVLVPAALLAAPLLWTCTAEAGFRHAGLLLQLAGLGLVALGIRETHQRFGRPSLAETFRLWLTRLENAALLPPITGHGSVVLGELRASGTASVTMTPVVVQQTAEDRIAGLEEGQKDLRQRLAQLASEMTGADRDLRNSLTGEAAAREGSHKEILSLIEEQAAGGLHLEMMGLVWLLVGTVVGSLSAELGSLLRNYPCTPW